MSAVESFSPRAVELGGLHIHRVLPVPRRRMVGAWCFLDRFGPLRFASGKPLDVAPHPHIGLQTVSWLVAGEIIHNDSLGCEALMRARQLNLMTAGSGIAHSEETPDRHSGLLDGVQLWVALPDAQRNIPPAFDHYPELPVLESGSARVTLIIGEWMGRRSPARTFSPILGAEIVFTTPTPSALPLDSRFEYAILVLGGDVCFQRQSLRINHLLYLGDGRDELQLIGEAGARALLIGGTPFGEPIQMWWNFVARTAGEIAQARTDWVEHRRFGQVKGYRGPRTEAPALSDRLFKP